jgi:hypothetical protein
MSEKITFVSFESNDETDAEKTPEQLHQELQEKVEEISKKIQDALRDDLHERGKHENIHEVPVLYQEYGTDCAIAVARMAMAYYGEEDTGTDEFVREATELGADVPEAIDAVDNKGPRGTPQTLTVVLEKHGINLRLSKHPLEESFVRAIKRGDPIYLAINFHTLYPDDTSTLIRDHAVLAKGYRLKEDGSIAVVVNDPKPVIGGERELTQEQLTDAMRHFSVGILSKELSENP